MSHASWYLARSSGLVAWFLLATSVLWGLMLTTRVFDRSLSPKWLTDLHRFLGGTAVVFTALHIGALVGDNYVHFGVREVLQPFASQWRTTAVAWGVISFWILVAIEATSLLMRYLPRRFWRAVHSSSFVLFLLATLHALSAGTDARIQAFVLLCTAMLAVVLFLFLVRIAAPSKRRRENPSAGSDRQARLDALARSPRAAKAVSQHR